MLCSGGADVNLATQVLRTARCLGHAVTALAVDFVGRPHSPDTCEPAGGVNHVGCVAFPANPAGPSHAMFGFAEQCQCPDIARLQYTVDPIELIKEDFKDDEVEPALSSISRLPMIGLFSCMQVDVLVSLMNQLQLHCSASCLLESHDDCQPSCFKCHHPDSIFPSSRGFGT